MGLDKLKNLSPLGLDKINKPSDSITGGRHGGIESSAVGAMPPHQDDHSLLDNIPGNLPYHKSNTYENNINSNQNGNFPKTFENLIQNSNNPLMTNHWEDIGLINKPVSQEVDFQNLQYGGFTHQLSEFPNGFVQNPILKFSLLTNKTQTIPLTSNFSDVTGFNLSDLTDTTFNNSVLDNINLDNNFYSNDSKNKYFNPGEGITTTNNTPISDFQENHYDPRQSRTIFSDTSWPSSLGATGQKEINFLEPNIYPGSTLDEINDSKYENHIPNTLLNYSSTVFDPRTESDVPGFDFLSFGNNKIPFYNAQNLYEGSALNNLYSPTFIPFSDSENDISKMSQYVGVTPESPYIDTTVFNDDLTSNGKRYNVYGTNNPFAGYDPRQQRSIFGDLDFGQKIIGFPNPKNLYKGTMFDDNLEVVTPTVSNPMSTKEFSVNYTPNQPSIPFDYSAGTSAFGTTKLEDQNQFNTLYEHNHVAKTELDIPTSLNFNRDKMFLRKGGFDPLAGWRGNEPYIVSDIPESQGIKGGRLTNLGGRIFPLMRGVTDLARLSSFFLSGKGLLEFTATQFALQFLNPRSKKLYNPLSLLSGIPLGANIKFRMDRAFLTSPASYLDTVYERWLDTPGEMMDLIAKPFNLADDKFGTSKGGRGNIFQVFSTSTNMINVAPLPKHPTQIITKANYIGNIGTKGRNSPFGFVRQLGDSNASLQTMNESSTVYVNKKLESAEFDLKAANAKIASLGMGDDPIKAKELSDLEEDYLNKSSEASTDAASARKTLFDRVKQGIFYGYNDIPSEGSPKGGGGNRYTNVAPSKHALDKFISEGGYPTKFPDKENPTPNGRLGDFMTTMDLSSGKTLEEAHPNDNEDIEGSDNGYPLYFKDLRNNSYIIFRGYVYGLSENVSPNWSETPYLGRSENIFSYENTNRNINFTLKLIAQTSKELLMIYKKLNRLTSLCYPEYKSDSVNFRGQSNRLRSKPPLTKFRLAELYGTKDNELHGFIKSLTYNYQSDSVWETKNGKRVPKFIDAVINYQVIHNDVPGLGDDFYGINHTYGG